MSAVRRFHCILNCNLFRTNWGRSVPFINSYSSLIYSVTHEIPTRKKFGPMKYPREKFLDPQNSQEQIFRAHEIPRRKNLGPTKYQRDKSLDRREKISDSWNTREKIRTHKINKVNNSDPQRRDGTTPTEFSTLKISILLQPFCYFPNLQTFVLDWSWTNGRN